MKTIGLADDLTGAGEVGICFALAGFSTRVSLQSPCASNCESLPEATVFNTGSRNLAPAEAERKLRNITQELSACSGGLVYKKIDSTLRGNIGVEIATVVHTLGKRGAIIAPAFPAQGRTTIAGYQLLYGIPVNYTATGRDQLSPVAQAFVPALLNKQLKKEAALLPLAEVEAGADALAERLEATLSSSPYCVVDAALENHLDIIAQALVSLGPHYLSVGTTGLAKHLAKQLFTKSGRALGSGFNLAPSSSEEGSVLVVCGSRDAVSLEQIKALTYKKPVAAIVLRPSNDFLEVNRAEMKQLRTHLARGEDVALTLGTADKPQTAARQLAEDFAEFLRVALSAAAVRGLVMVGGQTAQHILEKMHAKALIPFGQIADGIPVMQIVGGAWDDLLVITKGGGIGDPQALLDALTYFRPT